MRIWYIFVKQINVIQQGKFCIMILIITHLSQWYEHVIKVDNIILIHTKLYDDNSVATALKQYLTLVSQVWCHYINELPAVLTCQYWWGHQKEQGTPEECHLSYRLLSASSLSPPWQWITQSRPAQTLYVGTRGPKSIRGSPPMATDPHDKKRTLQLKSEFSKHS